MNSPTYLSVINKYKISIIVITVSAALLTFVFTLISKPYHQSDFTLEIINENRQETEHFQYDNFYSIQAAELLTNTLAKLLSTPGAAYTIYSKANLNPDPNELNKYQRSIKAKQNSAHLINVQIKNQNKDNLKSISESLISYSVSETKKLERTSSKNNAFTVNNSEPIYSLKQISAFPTTIYGAIAGLLLGIAYAFFAFYLKNEDRG